MARFGGSFLQSWQWGQFKQSLDEEVLRLSSTDGKFLAQIIKRPLFWNKSFFYLPRGPVWSQKESEGVKTYLERCIQRLEKETDGETVFLKVEFGREAEEVEVGLPFEPQKLGFCQSFKSYQPQDTLLVDLSSPLEDIYQQKLSSSTRYNIRYARRHDVKIAEMKQETDFEDFWKLLRKLAQRKNFEVHQKQYYKELFSLSKKDQTDRDLRVNFLGAYKEKQLIGGIIQTFYVQRGVNLHAANDYEYRNLNASDLLTWKAIKEAKKQGCNYYDLWGIIRKERFSSEQEYKQHDWYGLTSFKQKYGNRKVSYAGAFDFCFSPAWYKAYKFLSKFT